MSNPIELPFNVPLHDGMLARIPGMVDNTVLTIERQIYTYRICEYTDPMGIGRHWCYVSLQDAAMALADYFEACGSMAEPKNWTKAVDRGPDGHRVRRGRLANGVFVILEDEEGYG